MNLYKIARFLILVILFVVMISEPNPAISTVLLLIILLVASTSFASVQRINYDDFGKYKGKHEEDVE